MLLGGMSNPIEIDIVLYVGGIYAFAQNRSTYIRTYSNRLLFSISQNNILNLFLYYNFNKNT